MLFLIELKLIKISADKILNIATTLKKKYSTKTNDKISHFAIFCQVFFLLDLIPILIFINPFQN